MTWLSTHLGPTPKMSWGDGQRQADLGDTEDQRRTEVSNLEVSNCVE